MARGSLKWCSQIWRNLNCRELRGLDAQFGEAAELGHIFPIELLCIELRLSVCITQRTLVRLPDPKQWQSNEEAVFRSLI